MTQVEGHRERTVAQIGGDGEIRVYSSLTHAHLCTDVRISGICLCCQGKKRTSGGYIWKYMENLTEDEKKRAQFVREIPERRKGMELR